jgi:transcription elongation factor GreA
MQQELDYRRLELMPGLIEEVKRTRAFGDLSENFEYKAAKQAQNKNRSRIRYLEGMIKSARIIDDKSSADEVGLFDKVTMFNEKLKKEQTITIVTTLRQDALKGLISKESPVGKALMGRKVGERVLIRVSDTMEYYVEIRAIEKGEDDASMEISRY